MTALFRRIRFRPAGGGLDDEGRRAHDVLARVQRIAADAPRAPEWRDFHARRRRRWIRRIVVGLVVTVVAVGAAAGGWYGGRAAWSWARNDSGWLDVAGIEVTGLTRLTRNDILSVAGIRAGDPLLDVDENAVAARLALLPLVRTARVEKNWSRGVVIAIEERRPVAVVLADRLVEVDAEGIVLPADASGAPADLPIVRGLEAVLPEPGGRVIDSALPNALDLAVRISEPGLGLEERVSEIWAAEADSLVLTLMDGGVPVLVGRGDCPRRRLEALCVVLDDAARREEVLEYVDLRFVGQVVTKPRPEPEVEEESTPAEGPSGAVTRGAGPKGRRSRHGRNA
jgi:cell division protein FtsQ